MQGLYNGYEVCQIDDACVFPKGYLIIELQN